jgi:quinoprotein glucose dehydrogenase
MTRRVAAAPCCASVVASTLLAFSVFASAAQRPDQDWPYYGGEQSASKYSPLADINTANVRQLRLAWRWETGEQPLPQFGTAPGKFEATPIVIGGVMYLSTPYNRVIALDAASGRELWAFDPQAYRDGQVPNGTGFVHRGVAAWRDSANGLLRILINSRYRLLELDARTGEPVAEFGQEGAVNLLEGLQWPVDPKHYTNTSPPLVYRDLIILGNGVADRLIYRRDPPGDVRAFDARSGKLVWSFHTVPRDGEPGADTWVDGANHYTGHTNVWAPMSVDEARGLLYLPVSTPSNDFYGGNRAGANLFADSLVCLDAATGMRRWHYQLVHHGLWDYDMPAAPILIRLRHHRHTVDAVVQLTKQGYVFVFDRVTGKPLFPIEERPVPASDVPGEHAWPTQPASVGLPPLAPQGVTLEDATDLTPELHAEALELLKGMRLGPLFTPPSSRGTLMRPGLDGGADWGGGAFDPDSGLLYVKVNADPDLVFPDVTDAAGNVPPNGPNAGDSSVYLRHRIPVLKPPYAYLDALDLRSGHMQWQIPFGDRPAVREHPALKEVPLPAQLGVFGDAGVIVTRGGLVFAGGGDTAFHAIDKRSGAELWSYPTGAAMTTGTPMTYRVGGRQYVVIAVGGPGPGAALLAFALDSTDRTPASAAAAPEGTALPAGSGQELVARACSQCHALQVVTNTRLTRKQWEAKIDQMLARGAKLSDDEIALAAEYLGRNFGPPQ